MSGVRGWGVREVMEGWLRLAQWCTVPELRMVEESGTFVCLYFSNREIRNGTWLNEITSWSFFTTLLTGRKRLTLDPHHFPIPVNRLCNAIPNCLIQ